jgi:hypothetical protein
MRIRIKQLASTLYNVTSIISEQRIDTILIYSTLTIQIISVVKRIHELFFVNKNLWLDEAMLANAILNTSLSDLFLKSLPFCQSAPIAFIFFTKYLCYLFGKQEIILRLLPFLSGIAIIIFSALFAKKIKNDKMFIFLYTYATGWSLHYLHFSTEFKQYTVEAIATMLILYIYMLNYKEIISGKLTLSFIFTLFISSFFSTPSILISSSIIITLFLISPISIYNFIKTNLKINILLAILLCTYYFTFLKYHSNKELVDWWGPAFIPANFEQAVQMINAPLFGIFTSNYDFGHTGLALIFIISLVFMGAILLRKTYSLHIVLIIFITIFTSISVLKIYPFAFPYISGSRLILFCIPLLFIFPTFALSIIINKLLINRNNLKIFLILILLFIFPIHIFSYDKGGEQQTKSLIHAINEHKKQSDKILLYVYSVPAYLYYQKTDTHKFDILLAEQTIYCAAPYIIKYVNEDFKIQTGKLEQNIYDKYSIEHYIKKFSNEKLFILFSHFKLEYYNQTKQILLNNGYFLEEISSKGALLLIAEKTQEVEINRANSL